MTVVEVIARVVTLPFAVALRRHVLDYGLSNQRWAAYAVDLVKSEAAGRRGHLARAAGARRHGPALAACVAGGRRRRPRGAGAAGLAGLPAAGGAVVQHVHPAGRTARCAPGSSTSRTPEGVDVDDVLVADASRRTTTLNAYVSGFGSSRRVVVYDNLVEDLRRGRDRLGRRARARPRPAPGRGAWARCWAPRVRRSGSGCWAADGAPAPAGDHGDDPRCGPAERARDPGPGRPAGLLACPLENGISRRIETRADVDALRATEDSATFVEMQGSWPGGPLSDLTPPAWSQVWFGTPPDHAA